MYLLAKIHKSPLKTRAIISYSGRVCHGIAKWLDVQLKKIAGHMPFVAKSLAEVVTQLTKKQWSPSAKLFTMDAESIYTNIHLSHALPTFKEFFEHSSQEENLAALQSFSNCAPRSAGTCDGE